MYLRWLQELRNLYFDFLDILTDHSPALSTIPPQAMKRGYEVDIEEIHDGEWKIRLSK